MRRVNPAGEVSLFAGQTVLLISPQSWEGLTLSKHHYAVALSEAGAHVFFLNPPSGAALRPRITSSPEANVKLIDYRTIVRARRFLPQRLHDGLETVQASLIERQIGRPLDVVWSFDPTRFRNLRAFRSNLRVFHAVDRVEESALRPIGASADVVLSVSRLILDDFAQVGTAGFRVNHGLAGDFERAARTRLDELARTPGTPPSPPYKVGYVGNLLHPAIDHAAFARIVTATPEAEFHIWGPYQYAHLSWKHSGVPEVVSFIAFLRQRPNVRLHGLTVPRVVAEGLGKMDVLLTCYDSERELNRGSNNHKVLEYLSTGKPVVTNHVSEYMDAGIPPGLLSMPGTTDNAQLPGMFRQVIETLDELHRVELQERRIRFALSNTYSGKLREIEGIVGARLR